MKLRTKKSLIPSTYVVWSLTKKGEVHQCSRCENRMFVRNESGLCPFCWNDHDPTKKTHATQESRDLAVESILDELEIDVTPE